MLFIAIVSAIPVGSFWADSIVYHQGLLSKNGLILVAVRIKMCKDALLRVANRIVELMPNSAISLNVVPSFNGLLRMNSDLPAVIFTANRSLLYVGAVFPFGTKPLS